MSLTTYSTPDLLHIIRHCNDVDSALAAIDTLVDEWEDYSRADKIVLMHEATKQVHKVMRMVDRSLHEMD